MSKLSEFKRNIPSVTSTNPKASFNVPTKLKGLKKLGAVEPVKIDSKEIPVNGNLLTILLPKINTIVISKPVIIPEITTSKSPRRMGTPSKIDTGVKWYIDSEREVLVVGEGYNSKEYSLDSLTSFSSRSGKTVSKNEAQELANIYLKLKIAPQNKKEVFISAIRKFVGLQNEI